MAINHGNNFAIGGFNAAGVMAGQQGAHLAGMINQAQNAIQAENESRVAQERERRRMEHEKELMRMQMEQQERQAQLLQRLQAQRESQLSPALNMRQAGVSVDNMGRVVDRWRS